MARNGAIVGGITRQYVNGTGQDQIAMACVVNDDEGQLGTQEGNAYLIAAAPELLELLRRARKEGFRSPGLEADFDNLERRMEFDPT